MEHLLTIDPHEPADYDCCMLRSLVCWILIALTPLSLTAADDGAMLYGNGGVLRNGAEIPGSAAIFPADVLETRANSMGKLNSPGSSVVILPESLLEFHPQNLTLEHGIVRVATSHELGIHVGCLTVTPVSAEWTQFEVTNVDGRIEIAVSKNAVKLQTDVAAPPQNGAAGDTVHEGEHASREESDGCKADTQKKPLPGSGGTFSSPYVKYGLIAGAAGGIGLWFLLDHNNPASPWKP